MTKPNKPYIVEIEKGAFYPLIIATAETFKKECNNKETTSKMSPQGWYNYIRMIDAKMMDEYKCHVPNRGEYANKRDLLPKG